MSLQEKKADSRILHFFIFLVFFFLLHIAIRLNASNCAYDVCVRSVRMNTRHTNYIIISNSMI